MQATLEFARAHDHEKLVIWVRGSHHAAQGFYKGLGFRECGRLSRQVSTDDAYDDEVLLEQFL